MKFPSNQTIENEIKANIEKSIKKCLDSKEPIEALTNYIRILGNDLIQCRVNEKDRAIKAYQNAR